MRLGHGLAVAALSLGMVATAWVPAAEARTYTFKFYLSGKKETPPHAVAGRGVGRARYDDVTHVFSWHITYGHLTGAPTMAHFHGPARAGQSAPPIIAIDPQKLASPIEGKAVLTHKQAHELLDGLWYFNIHTADNPKGEIRGQLIAK